VAAGAAALALGMRVWPGARRGVALTPAR